MMDSFLPLLQLQISKEKGIITKEQYDEAAKALTPPPKKRKRQSRMSKDQKDLAKALRKITKWYFDVELSRKDTPLYDNAGAKGERMKEGIFLQIANKILKHMAADSIVAAATRSAAVKSIRKIVKERRYSVRPGSKIKLIYTSLNIQELVIYDDDGVGEVIPKPKPLRSDFNPATDAVDIKKVKIEAAEVPKVKKEVPPAPSIAKSLAERLILEKMQELQRQLQDLQTRRCEEQKKEQPPSPEEPDTPEDPEMLAIRKKADKVGINIVSTPTPPVQNRTRVSSQPARASWLHKASKLTLGGAGNCVCSAPGCGKDILASLSMPKSK